MWKHSKALDKAEDALAAAKEKARKARSKGGGEKCEDKPSNSFLPGTKVLMADGSAKPIEDVKIGDEVLATDPETGETRAETVTAEIVGSGIKHLVKVTLDIDGDQGSDPATVTATDGHPFWVPELGEWLDATDLQPGQWLKTSAGTHVQIAAVKRWTARSATVHNLTVSNLHTYHVLAGTTSVLVHNCNGAKLELTYKPDWSADQISAADKKVAALNAAPKLIVTRVKRSGSAADVWRRAGKKTVPGTDIDHKIDLQLGGADDVSNMWPLDSSVNRSLGAQISAQLKKKGLQPGDLVCSVSIKARTC